MKELTTKPLSSFSDFRAFVIKPLKPGALVTKKDQKNLDTFFYYPKSEYITIHCATSRREAVLAKIKSAKLSKKMKVYEISDYQFGKRWALPETIPNTGIFATKKQLAAAFEV